MTENHALDRFRKALEGEPDPGKEPRHAVYDILEEALGGQDAQMAEGAAKIKEALERKRARADA